MTRLLPRGRRDRRTLTRAEPRPPAGAFLVPALRRVVLALSAGVVAGALVRLRGTGGAPPQAGGWRELPDPPA
ncbi:MAG: hypothetical protein KY447_08840 [Actinobacteria bacterium]|nr:hypothetical protein [Actinomycetota bacterium]MBW3643003.1 hypothetical protein [Actinomycetota bacterium]